MIPIFIQDTVRSVCPNVSGPAWAECAANLSYDQIDRICSGLGPDTAKQVKALFSLPADDAYPDHPDLQWGGCLFNELTGAHREFYRWSWDGGHYVMKDAVRTYCVSDSGSSVSAFDSITTSSPDGCKREFESDLLAYLLLPMSTPGAWIAKMAMNNQNAINQNLIRLKVQPLFGVGYAPLPTLYVQQLSPTLMVTKTIMNEKPDVVGIFFRSLTGYDYGIR